jgi:hypothetical protein
LIHQSILPEYQQFFSIIYWTAELPDIRARLSSLFWQERPPFTTSHTFAHSSRASAKASLSSYSLLNLPNCVNFRFGSIPAFPTITNSYCPMKCIQSKLLVMHLLELHFGCFSSSSRLDWSQEVTDLNKGDQNKLNKQKYLVINQLHNHLQ